MQVDEDVEVVLDVQQARAYGRAYEAVDEGARDRSISEGHRGCRRRRRGKADRGFRFPLPLPLLGVFLSIFLSFSLLSFPFFSFRSLTVGSVTVLPTHRLILVLGQEGHRSSKSSNPDRPHICKRP